MRLLKAVCCAAAMVVFLTPGARADEWNKKTILTFSGPVQIPGATLAAGTYVFKLADLNGSRHVVQVFDKSEKHIYGTILAIPDKRLEATDKPVVLFAERPAGTPQAIRAWFYPGDLYGDEFAYPKSQAMRIAKEAHQSVLSMDESKGKVSDTESMKSAKLSRVDENGKSSEVAENAPNAGANQPQATGTSGTQTATSTNRTPAANQNKPKASSTTTTTTTTSADAKLKNSSGKSARSRNRNNRANDQNAVGTSGQTANNTAAANNNANAANRRSGRLPRTASSLELFELLSGLSLAGAFGIRRLRAAGAR